MNGTETGKRLQDRVALITGASRGIGRAVALRFATEGAHVILAARTLGALEEVDDEIRAMGRTTTLVPADLTDYTKIDQMGAAIFERFGHLDVLVGNAATLGILSPIGHVDPETWTQVIETNVTVNWRLIRSFDPLLKSSESGRAIFVTSGAARGATPYWGPYSVSKAALEMMVLTYAAEVSKTPVKVNLIDPGIVRTAMRAQAFPGEDATKLKSPEEITDTFVELAETTCKRHGEIVRA
ncbi:MAG: SDR family NAD(P)-dependent oxidoreductase [Rhodospirillales bacterium]|nr:SDR family NAD(P)-dependent oxidoreductase [Rhodospirillales bacterium]